MAPASHEGSGRPRHLAPRSCTRNLLLGLLGVLVVIAGLVVGLGTWQVDTVAEDVERIPDAFPPREDRPVPPAAAEDAVTFLVVGVDPADVRTGTGQAEAVTLLRLTADRRHAQVVFVPVDVGLGAGSASLDGAFRTGGPRGLVAMVEELSGVRVDHYAELNFGGLASVVDILGGVEVDVPEPYRNRGYDFAAGRQRMDGAAAVAYLRDVGTADTRSVSATRLERVVQAVFTRISERGAFSDVGRLTDLLDSVTGAVSVDDGLADEDLVSLAWEFRGVAAPEFLAVPLMGGGPAGEESARRYDDARAEALWRYLREDDVAGHLDEFR